MYNDSKEGSFSNFNSNYRSKTRTVHFPERSPSNSQLFLSQDIEKESLIRKIQHISEDNHRLKGQIENYDMEYSKLLSSKAEEIESLQMEKLEMEREIRLLKEKASEFSIDFVVQKGENDRLLKENEGLYEKIEIMTREAEKYKSSNTALTMRLDRANSTSFHINKEFENKNLKVQENYNKKISDLKTIYKKKIRLIKNELKNMKTLNKDLEVSEKKRLALLQEFDDFKLKVIEENNRLNEEHAMQIKRIEGVSITKLNELENQFDNVLHSENEALQQKIRHLQKELQENSEKIIEKERFFSHFKENAEKDIETLQKALETLQKTNEIQRKKILEQQDKINKETEKRQKETDILQKEIENLRSDKEEKLRSNKEELQSRTQRTFEQQKEIDNLKELLSQKTKEIEGNMTSAYILQEKISENQRLKLENDSLKHEMTSKLKNSEFLKFQIKDLENNVNSYEDTINNERERYAQLSKEIQEKNNTIFNLNKKIEVYNQKNLELQAENKLLSEQKTENYKHMKSLEIERNNAINKLQDTNLQIKIQDKRLKDDVTSKIKDFECKFAVEEAQYLRKIKDLESKIQAFELRENEYKELLNQKQTRLKGVQNKQQNLKEKFMTNLRGVRQSLKDLKNSLGSMNLSVPIEALGFEFQEKLVGLSGTLTRKMAIERHKIEGFYMEERAQLKEKHKKDIDELLSKLKEKEQYLSRFHEEKSRQELKENEKNNKNMAYELNKFASLVKEKEKENFELKNIIEGMKKKYEEKHHEFQEKIEKLELIRSKEKEKSYREVLGLRGEIEELYRKNKQFFDEFVQNIQALRENQEKELLNINNYNDEIIDVLKEKIKFYEKNEELLTRSTSKKELGNQISKYEEKIKEVENFYQEKINILENKHNQTLFQNTMETDKNLRNLSQKAQEIEKLEQKIKDLENVVKTKNAQIEDLSSKNSSIEGKLRNMQFQLELRNNNLNLKPVQISEELSAYKDEMLENPTLMPSNSFKGKNYNRISPLPLNNNYPMMETNNSDIFNKRISELRQISQSISTNPLNTFKELPPPVDGEDKKFELEIGQNPNLHRYSKSSSNFLQYTNKLSEKMNAAGSGGGFNSQRDRFKTEKKTYFHRKDQKSSLI